MARVILVIGVGASGTSATAGIIHKLGIPMGKKKFLGKHPAGFDLYEDTRFYGRFHSQPSFAIPYSLHRQEPIFGIKNTVMGLHLADKVIPTILNYHDEPRIVLCHRQALGSMKARAEGRCPPGKKFSKAEAIQWWLEAQRKLIEQIQKIDFPILHLQFEDLLENPLLRTKDLVEFCFWGMDKPDDEIVVKASQHIRQK